MDRKSSNRQVKSPLNFLLFIYIQDLDQHFLPIPNIPLRRFSELLSWTTAVLPMKVFPECVQRRVEGKLQEVVLSYTCNHCTNWLSRWGIWAGLMQHAGHTSGAPMGNRRGYRENGQIPHRQQWRAVKLTGANNPDGASWWHKQEAMPMECISQTLNLRVTDSKAGNR